MTYPASQEFEAGDFAAAERAYCAILDNFPRDTVAKFMLKECEEWRAPDLPIPPCKRAWDNQHAKTLQFETRVERFNACLASKPVESAHRNRTYLTR
jgi:hypothetical protein